ncbi:MAG: type III-A CRISPR-associated RAMP protein Csm3 [Lachnospiraceae bacterium]|nr:type III-A CRISPR-associated RAMP protein Csm3 [Lachnospiraceae bacterium]
MYAKIEITGIIEVVTGLHIGGSSAFSAIGAVDSPVIKDMQTQHPMIPGSSLKGKMRTLLAKQYNSVVAETPDDDAECLVSLFGSAKKGQIKPSKVLFSDMVMCNWDALKEKGLTNPTEIKFENSIKRTTAVANPRQIERVVRGAKFPLNIIYEGTEEEGMIRDFSILRDGFRLLQYDYLGGSGSRGYGKVKFKDLWADVVVGQVSDGIMEECRKQLEQI